MTMRWEHFTTSHTKINSRRIKDLDIIPEAIKLLEDNIEHTLTLAATRSSWPTSRVKEIKTKIYKRDLIKLKKLLLSKGSYK